MERGQQKDETLLVPLDLLQAFEATSDIRGIESPLPIAVDLKALEAAHVASVAAL